MTRSYSQATDEQLSRTWAKALERLAVRQFAFDQSFRVRYGSLAEYKKDIPVCFRHHPWRDLRQAREAKKSESLRAQWDAEFFTGGVVGCGQEIVARYLGLALTMNKKAFAKAKIEARAQARLQSSYDSVDVISRLAPSNQNPFIDTSKPHTGRTGNHSRCHRVIVTATWILRELDAKKRCHDAEMADPRKVQIDDHITLDRILGFEPGHREKGHPGLRKIDERMRQHDEAREQIASDRFDAILEAGGFALLDKPHDPRCERAFTDAIREGPARADERKADRKSPAA